MSRGIFISFEGGEGGGKTTQMTRLAGFLKQKSISVIETREPGGTPQGEDLRSLLVRGDPGRWQPRSELLMMTAARVEHVYHVIEPALAAGKWVLCDRFVDSTLVYQGLAGQVGIDEVSALHRSAVGGLMPDLTLLLDLPAEAGLKRAATRGGEARFEKKGDAFHRKLRDGFLELAAAYPDRICKIDAAQSFDGVWQEIEAVIVNRFGL